jgi:hypothetical protein
MSDAEQGNAHTQNWRSRNKNGGFVSDDDGSDDDGSDDDGSVNYKGDVTGGFSYVRVKCGNETIALLPLAGFHESDDTVLHQRADLIAASPDLLAALMDLMAIADPDGEATDIWAVTARAAIAKALGSSNQEATP